MFFFYKIGEQEGRVGVGWCLAPVVERGGRERDRRMKTVQIKYTHVCNYNNDTC
jgi:hypothetical protein